MLDIKAISKSYEKNGVKAVDKLSLRAENGEILGLLGPNGAGKTTTLKMITGILRPDEGDVEINGHSITTDALAAKREFASRMNRMPSCVSRASNISSLSRISTRYRRRAGRRRSASWLEPLRWKRLWEIVCRRIPTACARRSY